MLATIVTFVFVLPRKRALSSTADLFVGQASVFKRERKTVGEGKVGTLGSR